MGSASAGSAGTVRRRRHGIFGYHRNVYLMLFFTFGKGLQLSIAGLVTGLYAYSLGFDKVFVGILLGVPAMGSLVASIPTGLLADRLGRKPLLILGGLLNPLALVAIGLSTQAPALIVASFANGLFSDAYWVTSLPILTESTTEDERVGVLAANNFLMLGVGAVGSLVGGGITEFVAQMLGVPALSSVPLRWGILVAALVTFIPVLPLVWLHESSAPRRGKRGSRKRSPKEPVGAVQAMVPANDLIAQETAVVIPIGHAAETPTGTNGKHADDHAAGVEAGGEAEAGIDPPTRGGVIRLFAQLLIPDVLYTAGSGAALGLLTLYFTLHFHLDPGPLGVFLSVEGVIGGATAFIAPRLVRRWGKLRTATTVQYLSLPVILTIGFAPVFPLAAGAEVTRNALRGLFDPTYAAFTMERVSSRYRATLSGCYSVTWSVGFSSGTAAAGWLFQNIGYGAAVSLSAVLIALAATLLRLWFGGRRAAVSGVSSTEAIAPEAAPAEV